MTSVKMINGLLLFLCVLSTCHVNAFFDGFDVFKQFNQGFEQLHEQTRNQNHQLEQNLRQAFSGDQVRDVEPLEEDADYSEPEQVEIIPGSQQGFPSFQQGFPDFQQGFPGFQQGSPGGFFNMFGQVPAGRGPWWKGENVCVEREEIDESQHRNDTSSSDKKTESNDDEGSFFGSFEMSSCKQTDNRYTCTTKIRNHGIKKTFIVKYECCHGHMRLQGKPGCTLVNLKGVLDTMTDLGAKDFVELIKSSSLEEKVSSENLTLFVPTDDALRDFMDRMQRENQVEFFVPSANARRRRRSVQSTTMRELTENHMTQGLYDVEELVNEQVLSSEFDNSSLRINVYPAISNERVITCNCAKLVKVDNYASNGIIHTVDRVIPPVTKTLAEMVEQDEQFTTLLSMMTKSAMLDVLKQPGHVTLFAPTNAAFQKLPPATLNRLQQGHSCLEKVLTHHILSHSLCSAAIIGRVTTYNSAGDILHLQKRSDDGKLFIENVQIVTKDIMATNGIIHVIDDVLIPDSAKPMSEVLTESNMTSFVSLLNEAGLTEMLDTLDNITLLAPTNEALANPKVIEQLSEVRGNTDKLREVLLYHFIAPELQSCNLNNNQIVKTKTQQEETVRINLYASQPLFMGVRNRATAQCARIIAVDNRACGGVIHAIDRLMTVPNQTITQLIESEPRFSLLRDVIKGTELEKELQEKAPITFLAPTNQAFDSLEQSDMKRLLEDKKLASRVLKKHTLPESLCCAGVMITAWPFTNRAETLTGDTVAVRRDTDGAIHFGTTTVEECDLMATNGLVHAVNRVMVPRNQNNNAFTTNMMQRLGNPNVGVFLYGL